MRGRPALALSGEQRKSRVAVRTLTGERGVFAHDALTYPVESTDSGRAGAVVDCDATGPAGTALDGDAISWRHCAGTSTIQGSVR